MIGYKRIYSTFRQDDLGLIKSILEENKIDYHVANENAAGLYPLGINMDVMVVESQAEKAKELIKDFIDKTK